MNVSGFQMNSLSSPTSRLGRPSVYLPPSFPPTTATPNSAITPNFLSNNVSPQWASGAADSRRERERCHNIKTLIRGKVSMLMILCVDNVARVPFTSKQVVPRRKLSQPHKICAAQLFCFCERKCCCNWRRFSQNIITVVNSTAGNFRDHI